MKKKRLLALVLTIFVVLSCVSIPIFAEDACEEINITSVTVNSSQSGIYYTCKLTIVQCTAGQVQIYFRTDPIDDTSTTKLITKIEVYKNSDASPQKTFDNINQSSVYGYDIIYNASSLPSSLKFKIYYKNAGYTLTGSSNISGGGVDFKVDNTSVTTAASGSTVTATAKTIEGYGAALSSSDVTFTTNANGVATFTMPAQAVAVTATYTPYAYLDLESDATYPDSMTIDQTYTLTQTGDTTYTDKTKVKVEWTLPTIDATYTSAKVWNPDTMSWDESKNTNALEEKTATFTFTNYSSVKVGAQISFEKKIGTSETANSDVYFIDTAVQSDHSVLSTIPVQTITVQFTPANTDFNSLSAGSGTYGTYTAKIFKAVTVNFDLQGHGEAIATQTLASGSKVTAPTDPTEEGYTFGGWYKEAECSTQWDFDTDTVTANTTLYAKWTAN